MKHPAEIEEAIQKLKGYAEEARKLKRHKERRKKFQKVLREKLKNFSLYFILYLVSGDEKHLEKLKALELRVIL